MISVTTAPPAKSETRNPVIIEGDSSSFLIAESLGYFEVVFNTNPLINDFFRREIAGNVVTFIARAAAATPYEFKAFTNNTEFDQAVADFNANYFIYTLFDITSNWATKTIRFTEKIGGNAALKTDVTYSGDQAHSTSPGSGIEYTNGYKVIAQIHAQQDSTAAPEHNLKGSVETIPNLDEEWQMDISHVLRNIVAPEPPQTTDGGIELCSKMASWYWALIFDQFGSPVLPDAINIFGAANDYQQAFHGGIHRRDYGVAARAYLTNYISGAPNKFLTYLPADKMVNADALIWLYLWADSAVTELNTVWVITYSDGTTDSGTVYTETITGNKGAFYRFKAGFKQIGLDTANPAKTPVKYTIKVTDQADVAISETRTFFIQHASMPGSRFILFENPLGAFDTYWPQGYDVLNTRTETKVDRLLYPDPYESGPFRNAPADRFYGIVTRTGVLTKAEAEWLADIIASPNILFYNADLQRWELITVLTKELPVYNSQENINAWEIEFAFSRTE